MGGSGIARNGIGFIKFQHRITIKFYALYPPLMLKPNEQTDRHGEDEGGDSRVAIGRGQLGHILKIHTVPADDKRQRRKEDGEHGKNFHRLIKAQIEIGLIGVAQVLNALLNHTHAFLQPSDFITKGRKGFQLVLVKDIRLILPKRRNEIEQIIAVGVKLGEGLLLAEKAKVKVLCLIRGEELFFHFLHGVADGEEIF